MSDIEKLLGVPEEYARSYIENAGGDFNVALSAFRGLSYEDYKIEFLKIMKTDFVNPEDDSDKYSLHRDFEELEKFDISEQDYEIMLENANEMLEDMRALYKSEGKNKKNDTMLYILNGNYKKRCLNKALLTNELKVAFNVHGLTDDLYDLVSDPNSDKIIPVYYDKATTNLQWYSFTIFLEKLYKVKGMEANHLAPLILFDRDLMGIDTDEVTNIELMTKIMVEGRLNPYFHMREVARSQPTLDNPRPKLGINIASWTYYWLYAQNKNTMREQARQTGKTYDMGHTSAMEFSYASSGCTLASFHFEYGKAVENRTAWVGYANDYPKYMQVHNIITKKVRGKVSEIESPEPMSPSSFKILMNKKMNNKFNCITIGTSKSSAEKAGRGSTLRFLFGDEINFIKYIKAAFTALMFAHSTARKMAERNGHRTGIHFASTAGTLDTEQGRIMYKFIFEDMIKFDPILFQLDYEELTDYINRHSKNKFTFIDYSYKDLGLSEGWFDASISSMTAEEIRRDLLNHWLSTNGTSLFKTDALARIDQMLKSSPTKTWLFNKLNIFRFSAKYESFDDMIRDVGVLSIGMDFSAGDLNDYTTFVGVDLLTGERVFDFEDNNIDIPDTAIMIKALVKYIVNVNPNIRMVLVPEIDGPGKAIIPSLIKAGEITEKYIFRSTIIATKEIREPFIKSTSYSLNRRSYVEYGTSMRRVRDVLFNSLLFDLVDKYPMCFMDPMTSNELKTLVRNKTGKILAKGGFHDDKVCSTLHAYSPLFLDDYRVAMTDWFKIHLDVSNIEADPLTSTVYNLKEEDEKIEGKVEWTITVLRDDYGNPYDIIRVFKIDKASKRELNQNEIQLEARTNIELQIALRKIRQPRIALNPVVKDRTNERNINQRLASTELNTLRVSRNFIESGIKNGKINKKNISLI